MKKVIGGAAALAAHAVVTQQQLDDIAAIRGQPELQQFYHCVCQGLQCMLHIATAFKTGSVQLDKNSGFSGTLGTISGHYDGAVDFVGKAGTKAADFASRAGSFEGAANAIASVLDKAAEIADGIPIASFVLKGLSFIVNQVQGLKFDARMNRMIKSLFPNLNPLSWTFVVEEVARRVTVASAPDIQTLHSGTEDDRGRVKNWFRSKCSEYGLATLTSKAEDAVVMMALQKVDGVLQLALSEGVPAGLSAEELADFIVGHVVPSAPAPAPAPTVNAAPSAAAVGRASPPPPVALHDAASHSEVEQLRKQNEEQEAVIKKLAQGQAEQEERDKKREQELAAMRKQMQKLSAQDKDNDASGSGGVLVLASSKSEVNAETVNTAAAQAVRPVQQQVVRMEQEQQEQRELIAHIMSHSDPVLKSHLEDLNNAAVPVMKKHDDVLGWQDRYMAVRRGALFYADTYKAVVSLAESRAHCPGDEHAIDLAGCSVRKSPEECDKLHFAFRLTTPQVNMRGCDVPVHAIWRA
jgi:hypothetical protein